MREGKCWCHQSWTEYPECSGGCRSLDWWVRTWLDMVLVCRLSHRQILNVLSLCVWRLSLVLLLSVLLVFSRLSCRQLSSMLCLCIWRLNLENYWACHVCVWRHLGTFWACYMYVFEGEAIGSFWVCVSVLQTVIQYAVSVCLFQGWSRTGDFFRQPSGPQTKFGHSLEPFQL